MSMNAGPRVWPRVLLSIACAGGALHIATVAEAAEARRPWWDNYPLMVQDGSAATVLSYGGDVGFGPAGRSDPTWGIYGQKLSKPSADYGPHLPFKNMAYWEGFGEATVYAAELSTDASGAPVRDQWGMTGLATNQWAWQNYGGGPVRWDGVQNYFDDEEFARPYTRTHARYGAPPVTYPDGEVATGYVGDASNPLNSRVFDAVCAKDVLGRLSVSWDEANSSGKLDGLLRQDPRFHAAASSGADKYYGHMSLGKDSAAPAWIDYAKASALQAADQGIDALWVDNFSAWDSFGYPPITRAFGEWSVAGFRDYLRRTTDLNPAADFDVRKYLTDKVATFKGKPGNFSDSAWLDKRWADDLVWRAYLVFRRQAGTKALHDFYTTVKEAAASAGKPEFLVAGNDIPLYSLGWLRGDLDMVSTEMSPGWHMGAGSKGVGLPPRGKFAPIYKLAREHANGRLTNVWMYLPEGYRGRPGIASALEYEMLATEALPLVYPSNPTVAGTQESNAAFFSFVKSARETFGARQPVSDVGVYYSSSSILSFMAPGGFYAMDRQPHAFAHFGWATALGELHYQYRALPEWKLSAEALAGLRALIIPDSEVLDSAEVSILKPWVRDGGVLLVTGKAGERGGEATNFSRNPGGMSLSDLTGVTTYSDAPDAVTRSYGTGRVIYVKANLGMNYYLSDKARGTLLPRMADLMEEALPGRRGLSLVPIDAPSTVGLTLYSARDALRLLVDVNNTDIDLKADKPIATGPISFVVDIPEWLRVRKLKVRTMSPGKAPVAVTSERLDEGRLQVNLGAIQYYASVVIEGVK